MQEFHATDAQSKTSLTEKTRNIFRGITKKRIALSAASLVLGSGLLLGAEAWGVHKGANGEDSYLGTAWKSARNGLLYAYGQLGEKVENTGKSMRNTSRKLRQEPK